MGQLTVYRVLIQIVLPLIAPLAIYFLWLWYAGKRAEESGDEPPAFTKGMAFWAILIGLALTISSLAFLATTGGVSPDAGKYQPPRWEDGKIIGPSFE